MIISSLYKYYRHLNINIRNDLLTEQLGNKMVFVVVTDNTFYIYDTEKFKLLFIGPYIEKIDKVILNRDCLYITNKNNITVYKRGIVINKYDFENKIENLFFIGDAMFVIFNNFINLYDLTKLVNTKEDEISFKGSFIFHPRTYINKLIILQEDKVLLYNFIKNKILYTYINIKNNFLKMFNTKILDIIGVVYKNRIDIFNLKQDIILFTLDLNFTDFVNLDFSDDKMLVVVDNKLFVYDLVLKKEILQKHEVLNCKFIDNQYILLTTKTNISIYEICDSRLNIIKDKIIFTPNIQNFTLFLNKNVLLANNREVTRYDLYNDNNFAKVTYDKMGDNINHKFSISGNNVVVYKNFNLINIDLLNKRSEFIVRENFKDISLYKDRILVVTNQLYALNLKSKLVHFKINKFYENIIYIDNHIVSYKDNMLVIFDIHTKKEHFLELMNVVESVRVKDNIIMVKTSKNLVFYNITNLLRKFELANIIDWDINNKMLCILSEKIIYVYDLLSNIIIDKISYRNNFKFIRFSNDNFFILLVNEKDEIIMLCRKIYETTTVNEDVQIEYENINYNNKHIDSIKWNINDEIHIKYTDIDLFQILHSALDKLDKDYEHCTLIINDLIKKYYTKLDKEKLKIFYNKYKEISKNFIDNYIRCINY